jgi:hypothetical protein
MGVTGRKGPRGVAVGVQVGVGAGVEVLVGVNVTKGVEVSVGVGEAVDVAVVVGVGGMSMTTARATKPGISRARTTCAPGVAQSAGTRTSFWKEPLASARKGRHKSRPPSRLSQASTISADPGDQ